MDFREVMAEGDLGFWLDLVQTVANRHTVEILLLPEPCAALPQTAESVGGVAFYPGEVVMSEAAVAIGGFAGYGFAVGGEPRLAMCIAIVDAALAAAVPEADAIRRALEDEAVRLSTVADNLPPAC
jgi:hypothetical protein